MTLHPCNKQQITLSYILSANSNQYFFPEPSEAPQGILGFNTSSKSIFVQWTDPPVDHQNGIITEYEVSYKLSSASAWDKKTVSAPNKNTSISGLHIWSDYQFTVAASTSKGYGPVSSPAVTIKTEEDSK